MSTENMEILVESQNCRQTLIQYSKLRKEMAKKYESFGPIETPANPRADLSFQERKEFEGKIKLENKLIDTGYNRVLRRVI